MPDEVEPVDSATTALLIMDMQPQVVSNGYDGVDALIERLVAVRSAARAASVLTCYVRVAFRPGYPEVSPANRAFRGIAGAGRLVDGTAVADVCPELAPEPDDVVVMKPRVSAFHGTPLLVILQARGIRTLVLSGVATSGVMLSTLRAAADLDYRCVVLRDGCLDRDPVVHDVLVNRVFPRQADVVDCAELSGLLSRG